MRVTYLEAHINEFLTEVVAVVVQLLDLLATEVSAVLAHNNLQARDGLLHVARRHRSLVQTTNRALTQVIDNILKTAQEISISFTHIMIYVLVLCNMTYLRASNVTTDRSKRLGESSHQHVNIGKINAPVLADTTA